MKRLGLVVLSFALGGLGCLPHSFVKEEQKPPHVEMKEPAPPAVRPDDVTAANAKEQASALDAELKYEKEHLSPQPPTGGAGKQE